MSPPAEAAGVLPQTSFPTSTHSSGSLWELTVCLFFFTCFLIGSTLTCSYLIFRLLTNTGRNSKNHVRLGARFCDKASPYVPSVGIPKQSEEHSPSQGWHQRSGGVTPTTLLTETSKRRRAAPTGSRVDPRVSQRPGDCSSGCRGGQGGQSRGLSNPWDALPSPGHSLTHILYSQTRSSWLKGHQPGSHCGILGRKGNILN